MRPPGPRCQPVLAGSSPASRSKMASVLGDTPAPPPPGRREPAPRHRPALYATASSRCQPVLAGSSAASRSKMARYWRERLLRRRQVAASLRHVTDPAVARSPGPAASRCWPDPARPAARRWPAYWPNACSARRQVAASLRHVTDRAVRDRQVLAASRCWRDPARPAARRWPGPGVNACSAAARSPRACATSPTRLYATARSRCQPVLAGSSAASRSKMARYCAIRLLRRRQVAASLRHATDPAVRDRQLPLPAGVGRIQRGQPLEDGQVLA